MNSSGTGKNILVVLSAVLFLFTITAMAAAAEKPQSHPSSAPHASAPASHPSAPAQRPAGSQAGANRGAAGNTPNRGAGASGGMNRGPGGSTNSNNRGATGQANRGPGSNSMNRGPGGSQAGARGAANTGNRGTQGNQAGNRTGGNQTNRPGGNQSNRPGANQGGNRAGGNANAGNHAPKGSNVHTSRGGNTVQTRANGSVRSVSGHGVTVNRGLNGQRRVTAVHNGRTIVAYGRHGGYSQRAYFNRGGRSYYQRTYWRGGHAYAYGYRGYYWGGRPYYGYAPAYYWGPAYYGWAYNPWPAPVVYGWGWGGAPWYGFYGAYWAPYPVYPSAAFWLTDYFIAASLQAAYAAQAEAAAENGNLVPPQFQQESSDVIASLTTSDPLVAASLSSIYGSNARMFGAAPANNTSSAPAMTKEIKDGISDEIKGQIAAEKTAAANKDSAGNDNGPPAALDPNIRYFVVANDEDLTTSDGTECTLTAGDVVYRTTDQPDSDQMVNASVKASRKNECAVGATVGVSTDDLMDMYNGMRQNMSDGMKEMAKNSGKNGLPTAPDTTTTAGEVPAPSPDSNVQNDLNQAGKDADAAEADAKQPN